MNKKLLLSFILFFTFLTNYGQCNFGGSLVNTTPQSICYNRELISGTNVGGFTFTNVPLGNYVAVNVIQGLTYTISATTNRTFVKRITLFNSANTTSNIGTAVAADNNSSATLTNWAAPFTGVLYIRYTNNGNCSDTSSASSNISVIFTGGSNNFDSPLAQGTDTWIGHVYDFSNATSVPIPPADTDAFSNYLGSFSQPNTVSGTTTSFTQNFGGDDVCFPFTAAGTSQTLRTDTFAVRYRMRSTLAAGCYFVKVTGDDGVRLFVDGVKVFDAWTQQSSSIYDNVLVYLTGNSDLVFEYYEKNGANVSNFTIVPVNASSNTVTPATRTICGQSTGALDGSNYPYNGSTVNPTIKFQWQSSPSASGPWTDATTGTGFNAEDYTPAALTPSVINTTYYRRRVSPASNSLCYSDSAPVSITTNPKAVIPDMAASACTGSTFNVTPQDGTDGVVPSTTIYTWPSPTGGTVSGRAASTGNPTSISGTLSTTSGTPQVVTYTVTATKGSCTSTFKLLVTVYPTTIAGTVAGNSSVCAGTNSTPFTLSGNRGNVIRWESSTDNFTSVITPISNTTTTLTATDVTATTYYRAVVQNGSCATANSSVGTVLIKNPVATGVVICQGSPSNTLTASASCAGVTQTPLTASGTGGTSNSTSYTGAGNQGITINFPALPAGAVVTSTNVKINFQSFSPSWISELFIRVTPPSAMGPIQNDLNPFPNSSANNRADIVSDIPIGIWSTGNPAGNWIFQFKEFVDDDSVNPDARISNITITVNYTLPGTLDWFTTASGGTKIGSGSSFNPVGVLNSGLADTNTSGTTPYYVACSSDPACRTMVNYVINPAPVPVVGTILQPNCKISTGSIELRGLPLSGTLTRFPGSISIPYSGTAVRDSNLEVGTYSYTVGNGTCTSVATAGIPINAPPVVATYNAGSWSSPPTIEKMLVFAGNFISTGDIEGCACEVNSGVDVLIKEGHTLTIANEVKVLGGTLSFKNNSSLIQTNNDPTINSGNISYERISTPIFQKDYIYWSSPVKNQKLADLSPGTDPKKFFFNDGTNWVFVDRENTMDIGKGYIIRGPLSYNNSTKQTFTAVFKGVPNNGSLEGELLSKGKYHFIGNPYPSALNADALISQNTALLNGTIYFWTHNTPINLSLANQYTTDDYATYNLSGGVSAKSDINHNNPVGVDNGIKPTGKIAAGQSFFVSTRIAGKVQFNNTMRVGGANNGQFFKSGNTEKEVVLEKNRIWLNMTNDKGAFKQLLVGYIEGATNFYENRYDGITFDGNAFLDFYSVNNGNKFVIQGRALPFDDSDIVPLGYRAAMEGAFTISIDEVDGKMVNQPIYIEDKVTGEIHDLRTSNYTFKTAIGTFTDRLILRYTGKTLGTGDFENTQDGILISVKNKIISVLSSKENIKEVTIFDITGKTLYNKNKVSNTELQVQNLQSSNQVLLVKVILDNDFTTTRKIIFQ